MNIATPEFIANASTLNVDIYKHLAFINELMSTALELSGLTLNPNAIHKVTVVLLQYIIECDNTYEQITDIFMKALASQN